MNPNYIPRSLHWMLAGVCVALLAITPGAWASGPHAAALIKHDGGRLQGEKVRYMAASKVFQLTSGRVSQTVPASEVARVILAKQPPQLESAIAAVQQGQYAAAVGALKQIQEDYEMFGPDIVAARYLARSYLAMGKSRDALRACEAVTRGNPDAANDPGFASVYWEALLKEKRFSTLNKELDAAIQTGSRNVAAVALIKRGDILMDKDKPKEALLDGYLRVVLLFQDAEAIQPEALYKAIQAHKAANEHHFAEKWRKRLLAGYGTSDYAKKLN